jgi:hypothetical protein
MVMYKNEIGKLMGIGRWGTSALVKQCVGRLRRLVAPAERVLGIEASGVIGKTNFHVF